MSDEKLNKIVETLGKHTQHLENQSQLLNGIMTVLGQHTEEFRSIKNRLSGVEADVSEIKTDMGKVKETLKLHSDILTGMTERFREDSDEIASNTKRIEALETTFKN